MNTRNKSCRAFLGTACAALVIATGSVLYVTRHTDTDFTNPSQQAVSGGTPTPVNGDTQIQSGLANRGLEQEATGLKTNPGGYADMASLPDRELVHFSDEVHIPRSAFAENEITIIPEADEANSIATDLPDRYMIASTETGKVVRLPKKAYSDYACAELYQNYQCREKMAAIQSKMAASVATDFTDFIDLLKTLQDNP